MNGDEIALGKNVLLSRSLIAVLDREIVTPALANEPSTV
jgi:hypothetical protein